MMNIQGFRRYAEALGKFATTFLLAMLTQPVFAAAPQTVTYYYTDPQGTVLATTDAQGNILTQADRRPYGEQVMGTPQDGPGYTGHVDDPDSGLIYMQARYYDPNSGRFLSADLDRIDPANVYNFNRFAYANDNPAVNTDSTGRCVDGLTCDTMAQSFANHPEATEPLAPVALAGVAVMAAPTVVAGSSVVGQAASAYLARSAATIGADVAADMAMTAARQAGLEAQAAGASNGVAAAVVTDTGEVFTGLSTRAGGPGMPTNPLVKEALDAVPKAIRREFHGCCGEINAFSKLLNAGGKIDGATVAAVRAAGSGALNLLSACPSCAAVSQALGVTVLSPK